ncbi:MAG: hypothetical protein WC490_01035 [Candidatus Margulisiibacteriota bacterium]
MNINPEYLVDKKGKKKSVVFSLRDYERLMEYLENMEDSMDLKRAKRSAKSFKSLSEIASHFKRAGRLR